MAVRRVSWALVAAFAAAVGHLAWGTAAGPPAPPDYEVGGAGPALAGDCAGRRGAVTVRLWSPR